MDRDTFAGVRVEYGDEPLARADLPSDPWTLFRSWLDAARAASVPEPNGMSVATVDGDGQPQCRVLLLKQLDERGLVFFSNRESDKGAQLAANPRAAATFWWPAPRNRQVRVTGRVEPVPDDESDAYFRTRPRRAQLCSAASPQSRVVASRDELESCVAELAARIGDGPVPRPRHWGGYRLHPAAIEFWQGREGRLHDRFRFTARDGGWLVERLAP